MDFDRLCVSVGLGALVVRRVACYLFPLQAWNRHPVSCRRFDHVVLGMLHVCRISDPRVANREQHGADHLLRGPRRARFFFRLARYVGSARFKGHRRPRGAVQAIRRHVGRNAIAMLHALRSVRLRLVQPVLVVRVPGRFVNQRLCLSGKSRLRQLLSNRMLLVPALLGLGMLRLPVVDSDNLCGRWTQGGSSLRPCLSLTQFRWASSLIRERRWRNWQTR